VPTVWTSTDGVAWTQVTVGLPAGLWYLTAGAAAPWGFALAAAVSKQNGFEAHVVISPDGMTWTDVLQDATGPLTAALGSGGEVLLFGSSAMVRVTDPLTWVRSDAPFGGFGLVGAGRFPDGRVIVAATPSSGQAIQAPIWISTPG